MLYCRLISNSAAMALEEKIALGAYGCIPSPQKAVWINAQSCVNFAA